MKKTYSFLLIALFVYSCGYDLNITTQVHPNGSITRTMVSVGDSSDINNKNTFPISIDSTWTKTIEWEKDSMDYKTKFIVTVSKTFANADSLNNEFNLHSVSDVKTHVKLKKKFNWFFTKYEYTEIYQKIFPFDHYPIADFYSPDEIRREIWEEPDSAFYSTMDSTELAAHESNMDTLFFKFYISNVAAEFLQLANTINNPNVAQTSIDELELNTLLMSKGENIFETLPDTLSDFLASVDSTFATQYNTLYQNKPELFTAFQEKCKLNFLFGIPYSNINQIELPGILIASNVNNSIDEKHAWQFDSNRYAFQDFELTAESRVLNKWTIYVSVLILLLALASILLRKKE